MGVRTIPPWHYRRTMMPCKDTFKAWRKRAMLLAREQGAEAACHFCKRPLKQWGYIHMKHPRSYGNQRRRIMCIACANLIIHMMDVLEWYGAQDHMAPEDWGDVLMPKDWYNKIDEGVRLQLDPGED